MPRRKRSGPRARTRGPRTQQTPAAADNTRDILPGLYLPEAEAELNAIKDGEERVAVVNAVEKVKQLGPKLPIPTRAK